MTIAGGTFHANAWKAFLQVAALCRTSHLTFQSFTAFKNIQGVLDYPVYRCDTCSSG